MYGEDELTDRPMRWLCAEMVREALFELLDQELPYSMAVEVLSYDESRPKAIRIGANLLVERDSQKRIVVGKGGSMIKTIGRKARGKIEHLIERPVYLDLRVKVMPNWRRRPGRLKLLGYDLPPGSR